MPRAGADSPSGHWRFCAWLGPVSACGELPGIRWRLGSGSLPLDARSSLRPDQAGALGSRVRPCEDPAALVDRRRHAELVGLSRRGPVSRDGHGARSWSPPVCRRRRISRGALFSPGVHARVRHHRRRQTARGPWIAGNAARVAVSRRRCQRERDTRSARVPPEGAHGNSGHLHMTCRRVPADPRRLLIARGPKVFVHVGHQKPCSSSVPHAPWYNTTPGVPPASHRSPQRISATRAGESSKPISVKRYSSRGGCAW